MTRETSYTVLLIEPDRSLRRLLTLGLEQQGMQVIGIGSFDALADRAITDPDLLLLDIDNGYRDDASLLAAVQEHPYLRMLPTFVLAWEPELLPRRSTTLPLLEYAVKPFDARTLYTMVVTMLETSAAIEVSARLEHVPTAAAVSVTAFSGFSPLLTAIGLLLAVIGFMLQPLIAGVGLLIVLVGLLWWTLGTSPQQQVLIGESGPNYASSSLRA